ncbi:putative death-receptor fusion protein-domain-containing protein [Myxozyma melibiosi]|uniref:Death-receptor fusion protein-domain-containing protein n=1 Tax=Myxozyma melibiosi TaxID=54550 RepID=A0ABR1F8J8_9ASCO
MADTVAKVLQLGLSESGLADADLRVVRQYIVGTKAEGFLTEDPNSPTSLSAIYPILLKSLLQSPGLGDYRTIACDTLSVWLQRTIQCCSLSPSFADSLKSSSSAGSVEDADAVFDFVCNYWTDSGAALGNALRELLTKLILFLEKIWTPEEYRDRLAKWAVIILRYPRSMRVVYFTIEILARQLGGSVIMQSEPRLIKESLLLIYSNALANPIGKMINAILTTILKEKLGAATKSAGRSLTANEAQQVENDWLSLWSEDVIEAIRNDDLRPHIQTYLLPNLFKASPFGFKIFIQKLQSGKFSLRSEKDITLLIGCLKIGQDLSILDSTENSSAGGPPIVSSDFLRTLLHHSSDDLRIGGLSLAVSSPQASKPISSTILKVLFESMDDLVLESDPEFRNRVYGFLRQMVTRLRDSSYAMKRERVKLAKKPKTEQRIAELDANIEFNKKFLERYLAYLQQLLRPGSSYQRMHMSLKLLQTLIRSGLDNRVESKWHEKNHIDFTFHVPVYSAITIRLLLDNFVNNYEDIRETSSTLLKMAPLSALFEGIDDIEIVREIVDGYADKGIYMISGLRGREGDGGARILDFCFYLYKEIGDHSSADLEIQFLESLVSKLEEAVKQGKDNLSLAVKDFPLHGYFTSLKLIFEQIGFAEPLSSEKESRLTKISERILSVVHSMWGVVEKILCHDSPEGNMPEEIEENYLVSLEEVYGPATQVILSYAWRAIGESSGLLTVLLSVIPLDSSIIAAENISDLGDLLLTELATIRHRGAFSSVYPTFVACCSRCNRSNDIVLRELPKKWLDDHMQLIQEKSQYITRRSGGLPFLVAAVLTAETDASKRPLLHETFTRLSTIAKLPPTISDETEKMDLPQVHALNCIKSIFVETRLSAASAFYVDQALAMAIDAFASSVWSIRNCGVMLFAALQTRLFGSRKYTDSRLTVGTMSARLFFSRFKDIKGVLLNHLQEHVDHLDGGSAQTHIETVYPVLSLLSRLESTDGYDGLDAFAPYIMKCLSSRIWKIREMAARAVQALISYDAWETSFCRFLSEVDVRTDNNGSHGRLLALESLLAGLAARASQPPIPKAALDLLVERFDEISSCECAPVALTFLRVVKAACEHARVDEDDEGSLEELQEKLNEYLDDNDYSQSIPHPGSRMLQGQKTTYYIGKIVDDLVEGEIAENSAVKQIMSCLNSVEYDVQLAALKVLLAGKFLSKDSEISGTVYVKLLPEVWQWISDKDETEDDSSSGLWSQLKAPAIRLFSAVRELAEESKSTKKKATKKTGLPSADTIWQWIFKAIESDVEDSNSVSEASLEALGTLSVSLADNEGVFEKWYLQVVQFSDDNSPFSNRNSALKSLINFVEGMSIKYSEGLPEENINGDDGEPDLSPTYQLRTTLMHLHDFLNDDDDELREIATKYICCSPYLLNTPHVMTTIQTSRMFANYIVDKFSATAEGSVLAAALARRLVSGSQARSTLSSAEQYMLDGAEAVEQFYEATQEETALFVIEKQNLYRNEVSECELWAYMFTRLARSRNGEVGQMKGLVVRAMMHYLYVWVMTACGADMGPQKKDAEQGSETAELEDMPSLVEAIKEMGMDGPLGWSCRMDTVFLIGRRIEAICKVLMVSGEGVLQTGKIEEALRGLRGVAEELDLHPLWLE